MTQHFSSKNESEKLFLLEGRIIDFDETVKKYDNNPETVKEILRMLLQSFSEEIPKIQIAKEKNDLEVLLKLVHRLKGSAAYCGAERLQLACSHFEDCLHSGDLKNKEPLYEQLLREVESVKEDVPRHL